MTIPPGILDYLRSRHIGTLAAESDGRFPLDELEEAARSGIVSADLEEWLERRRERDLAEPERVPIHSDGPIGSRQDAPSKGTQKNYQQGPAD